MKPTITERELLGIVVHVHWLPKPYRSHCVCAKCIKNCRCISCLAPPVGHIRCANCGCVWHFHSFPIRHQFWRAGLWLYRKWWKIKGWRLRRYVYDVTSNYEIEEL